MANKKEVSTKAIHGPGIDLDFSTAPTTWQFLQSDAFVRGLMGPVGSGKSYACAAEIMMRAVRQKPSPVDGIRYTRFVIVRNSYPELKTTTIKTWQDLFPENKLLPVLTDTIFRFSENFSGKLCS